MLALGTKSGVFGGLRIQISAAGRPVLCVPRPHAGAIEPKGTFMTEGWQRGRDLMKAKLFIPTTLCFRTRRKL